MHVAKKNWNDNNHNSDHLAQKCGEIFSLRHWLFLKALLGLMPTDKYLIIFSPFMEAMVFIFACQIEAIAYTV